MYILGRRIYASNDVLFKMWAFAAALILGVAAFLSWNDRFRESVDTSVARISPFGAEAAGTEKANFTGKRGFFNKMNKMGLPPSTRRAELAELFAQLAESGAGTPADGGVPVLWVYAEGLTKEARDRGVQTYGKFFFDKARFCYSVVDENGFAVQLDPETFRILWAKDGGAICALPLLQLPENCGEAGFSLRVEERGNDGAWRRCGEIAFPPIPPPEFLFDEAAEPPSVADAVPAEIREPAPEEIVPAEIVVERFAVPRECRFFSAPPRERAAFGELDVRIRGNASGKVPAEAWTLIDFALFAPNQEFPASRTDAFHRNVRFLEGEIFDNNAGGVLRVPAAKTLFPAIDEAGETLPWNVEMRFAREAYFPEDFHAFPPLRVARNDSVIGETLSANGSSAKIRAFRKPDYFRLLNNDIPAVVLEIAQTRGDDEFFWAPFRVKTDAGEELFPESVVNVEPGVRQYWFVPRRGVPATIEVVYAVTRCVFADASVVPEIVAEEAPAAAAAPRP